MQNVCSIWKPCPHRNAVSQYKERYLRDKASVPRFTQYMIAIVNNCQRFRELAQVCFQGLFYSFTIEYQYLENSNIKVQILNNCPAGAEKHLVEGRAQRL